MSFCDDQLTSPIRPIFTTNTVEDSGAQKLIAQLHLQKHPEGGYFSETDRDPLRVPNPFRPQAASALTRQSMAKDDDTTRSASTTIYYLLTPAQPKGNFS